MPPLRVVLVDVDGVITPGEGCPADLSVFEQLVRYAQAAEAESLLPRIALCTGRPAPYVEFVAQLAQVDLPCIFEHGCGLYFPRAYSEGTCPYEFHPDVGRSYAADLAHLRELLRPALLDPGLAFVQPGKEASMSLYPLGGVSLDALVDVGTALLERERLPFTVTANVHGVEFRRVGVDKGSGARWLAQRLEMPLQAFAAVGDSDPDLCFLELAGYSAAPANATPAVKAAVDYVASAEFGEGLVEILGSIEQRNRADSRPT
ncbi:MAG: HAD hydrolase family protein [Chloroflexi bacterium]|nr:HAD hydrolase family protein [Chloroflexota bacterium]